MRNLAALVAATVLAACAPQQFRGYAGASFMSVQGEVGLQNSAGNLNLNANMNSLENDLDVGDSDTSPYLRFDADWDRHRAKVSGFAHNSSGNGTLSGDFGDLAAGTLVFTDLDFIDVTGSWSYDLMSSKTWRLAPGVQLAYYSLDVAVRAQSINAFEKIDTSVVAPMPYVEAEVDFGPVSLGANFGAIAADLGDANGRYWDAEALVRVRPARHIELIAGARYLLFDAHGIATDRDFDADLEVFGWFVGGGVTF
jgi:hypothetical protein